MADWNEIKTKITVVANRAVKKTGEVADTASKHVKLKMLDSKLSSKYEDLGRLTYKQLKNEVSQAEKIAEVVAEIDTLRAERMALKKEIEAEKQRRAEAKEEAKAQAKAEAEAKAKAKAEAEAEEAEHTEAEG